jgi:hypothetical protein
MVTAIRILSTPDPDYIVVLLSHAVENDALVYFYIQGTCKKYQVRIGN